MEGGEGSARSTHFSPITTFSMTTQLVNFEPFPTLEFLPTMHRFKPTFSPRAGYTERCRCESGEMNTPGGVLVGGGLGGNNLRAYIHPMFRVSPLGFFVALPRE